MVKQSKEIKKILSEYCDGAIWCTDRNYHIPNYQHAIEVVKQNSVSGNFYKTNVFECEEFALAFLANIRISESKMVKKNAAFGMCSGYMFDGNEKVHTTNFCLTTTGLFLIEPQTDVIRVAIPEKDKLFFVWM